MSWAERTDIDAPVDQGSRPRGKRHTRAIVEAARRLIAEKGEFTTQELVNEAGVALQTFYRHFAGKDQLLLAVIEDAVAEQAARAEQAAQTLPDPIARLRFYVTDVLGSLGHSGAAVGARYITAEHWRLYQLFPEEVAKATQPFVDMVLRELAAARDDGLLAAGDSGRDAWLVENTVRSVYHHYAFAPLDREPEDIAEHLWTFVLRGLGGSSGSTPANRPRRKRRAQ